MAKNLPVVRFINAKTARTISAKVLRQTQLKEERRVRSVVSSLYKEELARLKELICNAYLIGKYSAVYSAPHDLCNDRSARKSLFLRLEQAVTKCGYNVEHIEATTIVINWYD